MEDIIDIIVTETTNLIEITSQSTDEVIDVNIIDNREDITLNVTPSLVEININSLTGNFGVNWGEIGGTLSSQTDLNTALGLKADLVDGKVPSSQLPSYVDDVVEVATYSALPATGETGKIYVVLDTNKIYRWSGSVYVEIVDSTAVWGAITGTLSSQTDLQSALDAKQDDLNGTGFVKASGTTISYDNSTYLTTSSAASTYVPYTGATANVNLGQNYSLTAALIIKSGGTSTQFLKADGTIDTNTYALDSAVVKLTGNQTIAGVKTFTSGIVADVTTGGTQGFASTNSSASGSSIFLQNNSTSVGNAIGINNTSTADGIAIGNETSGRGIYISNATTSGSGKGISIDNYNGGIGIEVGSDSTADAIKILHLSGRAFNIQSSGGGYGVIINNTTASTSAPFTIQKQGANKITFTDAGAGTFVSTISAAGATLTGALSGTSAIFSGNVIGLQLGVGGQTPRTSSSLKTIESSNYVLEDNGDFGLKSNAYYNGTNNVYINSAGASRIYLGGGSFTYYDAPSGTAGGTVTFTPRFTIANGGAATFSSSVGVGGSVDTYQQMTVTASTAYTVLGLYNTSAGSTQRNWCLATNDVGAGDFTIRQSGAAGGNPFAGGSNVRLYINSSGNVGIGTTAPTGAKLDIREDSSNPIRWGSTSTQYGFTSWDTNLAIIGGIGASTSIGFWTNGNTERMRITSSGNVGIGTTAPSGKLDISHNSDNYVNIVTTNANNSSVLTMYNSTGTTDGAAIGYNVAMRFGSVTGLNASGFTERMRITSAGGVGINTTPDSGFKLHVNGYVKFNDASGVQLSSGSQYRQIYFDGFNTLYFWNGSNQSNLSSAGAWVNASDQSIKKDVIDIKYGLSDLMLLNPRSYKMKTDDLEQIGFIAQEVEQIIPEVVNSDNKGMKGLSYGNMVALLTKSIQELKAELDALKA